MKRVALIIALVAISVSAALGILALVGRAGYKAWRAQTIM